LPISNWPHLDHRHGELFDVARLYGDTRTKELLGLDSHVVSIQSQQALESGVTVVIVPWQVGRTVSGPVTVGLVDPCFDFTQFHPAL
jgi:hypothetical protein